MVGTIDYRDIKSEDLKRLSDKRVLKILQIVRSMRYSCTHDYNTDDYEIFSKGVETVKAELDTRGHVTR